MPDIECIQACRRACVNGVVVKEPRRREALLRLYNDERPHQTLGGLAPSAAYYASLEEQHVIAEAA